MPTLDWIGKAAVVNHHREVPTRLLHCDSDLSYGDPEAGNLLVQGDNLEALKALLPYYAGKVKCIFIDPPYNTGNEGWIYNDNVSSPELLSWLGEVTGRELEDLSRHDKWLCMIYPRLRLLRDFLSNDGSIWITLDDNEAHYAKILCDEIFGRSNFVSTIIWEKDRGRKNDTHVSSSHDFVLVYAKQLEIWKKTRNLLQKDNSHLDRYKNPDGDPRGPWRQGADGTAKSGSESLRYEIALPSGRIATPPSGNFWRFSKSTFEQALSEGRVYFGKDGNRLPIIKKYLSDIQDGLVPKTWWPAEEVGSNQEARRDHLRKLLPDIEPFATPKPERLISRILEISTNQGDLVLDSFAGSGTTGAVAHKLDRRWLMVEMGEHAQSHITPRLRKVIDGADPGGVTHAANWTGGGGFRFCTLGRPLFDEWGSVTEGVTFSDLAAFVFFSDTGSPIPAKATGDTPLLGTFEGRAIHLLFAPDSLGAADVGAGKVLTLEVLEALPPHDGPRVVYAEGCTVSAERLAADGVVFKQVPYQLQAT